MAKNSHASPDLKVMDVRLLRPSLLLQIPGAQ